MNDLNKSVKKQKKKGRPRKSFFNDDDDDDDDFEEVIKKKGRPKKIEKSSKASSRNISDSEEDDFSGFDDSSSNEAHIRKVEKLLSCTQPGSGSFEVYFEQHKEEVLSENPNLTDNIIRTKLQTRWRKMTKAQKARLACNFFRFPFIILLEN